MAEPTYITVRAPFSGPSRDWIEDCMIEWGRVLTGGRAHWCPEWDFLPIDDTVPEIKSCICVL